MKKIKSILSIVAMVALAGGRQDSGGIKGESSGLRLIPALAVGDGGLDGEGGTLYEEGESSGGRIYHYITANGGSFNRGGDSFGNQKMLAKGENSEGRSLLISDDGDDVGGRSIVSKIEPRGGEGADTGRGRI